LTGLVAVRQHVPRVVSAFASIGPFLASFMLVAAIFAKSAGFGTIWVHPLGIVVTLASLGPSVAIGVVVTAIRTVAAATAVTTASAATGTASSSSTTSIASRDSIAIVSGLELVAEEVLDALAVSSAQSARARSLRTRLRAHALAFVVLVARLLATVISRAVFGTAVHDIHDALIRVCQMLLSPDRKLEILISGDDGHPSVVGEGIRPVMHDRTIVIGHAKWPRVCHLVEIESLARLDVLQLDDKSIVTVHTTLLVM